MTLKVITFSINDILEGVSRASVSSPERKKSKVKGLFKRSQHVGPTSPNIVGCNMLASFEHHVG